MTEQHTSEQAERFDAFKAIVFSIMVILFFALFIFCRAGLPAGQEASASQATAAAAATLAAQEATTVRQTAEAEGVAAQQATAAAAKATASQATPEAEAAVAQAAVQAEATAAAQTAEAEAAAAQATAEAQAAATQTAEAEAVVVAQATAEAQAATTQTAAAEAAAAQATAEAQAAATQTAAAEAAAQATAEAQTVATQTAAAEAATRATAEVEMTAAAQITPTSQPKVTPEGTAQVEVTTVPGQVSPPTLDLADNSIVASLGQVDLSGTGQPGSQVEIVVDGRVVGTTTVGSDGAWRFRAELPPRSGAYQVSVRAVDASGNVLAASQPVSLTVVAPFSETETETATPSPAPPVTEADGQAYIVQADDWLSKLAQKFYGDMFAYPVIVEATNAKAKEDSSFTIITNPDLIEIGQKLWIPAAGSENAAGE